MSDALYERYKDALRRGHVAALRGRHAEALDAYGEAAGIAPDRALPLVGMAGVLARVGRHPEALSTYDAALDRAPDDEGALRGRAETLASIGDRAEAADAFDRLATVLDAAGRLPDAAEAARRALELAESRGRRAGVRALAGRLRAVDGDASATEVLDRVEATLEGPTASSAADPGSASEPGPEPVPFDPAGAMAGVEDAADGEDHDATRSLALAAAAGHRAAGQPSAAIDVCYIALAGSPADPDIHLALAELYLDQGWRSLAIDKLVLLRRLIDLDADADAAGRLRAIARARLADEPRVADLVA